MFKNKITTILTTIGILFFVSYIFFASTIASLGYELSDRKLELSQSQQLLDEIVVELANRQSPDYLTAESSKQAMVEISIISRYIDTRATSLGIASP